MIWSFSAYASFRKCPRQWFYKRVYASSLANDSARREAYRLSKLQGLLAWRGRIVDTVISEFIVPSISTDKPLTFDDAMRQADTLFAKERTQLVIAGAESGFFEIEYGKPVTEEMFGHALNDIHAALENFYAADSVWTLLASAMRLVPQRTLSFGHAACTVQVRPDLIAFYPSLAPVVFDWKVNTRPLRDYWLQLVTGALALTRCTPHRDWPLGGALYKASDVQLLEVQLLAGDIRCHHATAADVEDAEDFISSSMAEMEFAYQCDVGDERLPEDFPVANDPFVCQVCPFRKPCWGQTG